MKKVLSLLLVFLCITSSIRVFAESEDDVSISQIDGVLYVSGIGVPATDTLFDKATVTRIEIGEGITKIPDKFFADCKSLESVKIASTVEEIGQYAFSDCSKLKEIELPEEGKINFNNWALKGCNSLETFNITKVIGEIKGFSGYHFIKTLNIGPEVEFEFVEREMFGALYFSRIPSSVTEINIAPENENYIIEDGVLFSKDKTSLILYLETKDRLSYTIPDSVKRIEKGAFCIGYGFKMDEIIVPEGVEYMECRPLMLS